MTNIQYMLCQLVHSILNIYLGNKLGLTLMNKLVFFCFISILALPGCGSNNTSAISSNLAENELDALRSYRNLQADSSRQQQISNLRYSAMRNTAMSLGARGALSFRAAQINEFLNKNSALLDRIFNFNAMLLENNILSPVLIEGRNTLIQDSENTLRFADRTYTIAAQARFVTVAPSWRDYLQMNYLPPETPDKSLLPKNSAESQIWQHYVEAGWQAGLKQAETIYQENLGKLKRDIEGMIRYKTLLTQNMVSAPYVAKLELGITGGGNDLTVNDRVLRITALPYLKSDSKHWKTEISRVAI